MKTCKCGKPVHLNNNRKSVWIEHKDGTRLEVSYGCTRGNWAADNRRVLVERWEKS